MSAGNDPVMDERLETVQDLLKSKDDRIESLEAELKNRDELVIPHFTKLASRRTEETQAMIDELTAERDRYREALEYAKAQIEWAKPFLQYNELVKRCDKTVSQALNPDSETEEA